MLKIDDTPPNLESVLVGARKLIKIYFNINLSIIERVELKQCVTETMQNFHNLPTKNLWIKKINRFCPVYESAGRFMHDYYQLPYQYADFYNNRPSDIDPELKELVQRKQYRMHNPLAFKD